MIIRGCVSSFNTAEMTDKEYAPLTTVCVKALNDKLYERRKVGALEIER